MKLASILLATVMVTAMAGQAAEARDHDGWRNHQRAVRNYNKQLQRQQRANNRIVRQLNNNYGYGWNGGWNGGFDPGNSRPWDNAHDNSIRALQEIQRMQQAQQGARWW